MMPIKKTSFQRICLVPNDVRRFLNCIIFIRCQVVMRSCSKIYSCGSNTYCISRHKYLNHSHLKPNNLIPHVWVSLLYQDPTQNTLPLPRRAEQGLWSHFLGSSWAGVTKNQCFTITRESDTTTPPKDFRYIRYMSHFSYIWIGIKLSFILFF